MRSATTRRMILGAAALSPLAACATKPEAPGVTPLSQAQASDFTLYPKIIDTASDVRPHLATLKALGVWTVFRYYAREPQSFLPEKRLRLEEADELIAAGFSIGVVYQYFNNLLENMTAERGRADADYALEHAAAVQRQPKGSAVYFGVDGDWTSPEAQAGIAAYFTSVREIFDGSGYRIGAYGSGATLAFLEGRPERPDYAWLAYPQGWSGAASYFNTSRWRLFQSALETRAGGLAIDANIMNPEFSDVGQWGAKGVDYGHPKKAREAIVGARRFVANKAAKLRIAPDDAAAEIVTARFRKGASVRVLSASGGWAALDVNEEGRRTGYARLADLTADYSRRPDFFAPDA